MAIGELHPQQPVRRLETLYVPIAIGLDTFSRGRIRAVTTEAVVRTLNDYRKVLDTYGLQPADCRVVATSAVRDAPNRDVFLDRIDKGTGFKIEVLEAIEETRLARQLMQCLIGELLNTGRVLMLALGAGTTHIILHDNGEIESAESRPFGTLRLFDAQGGESAARAARRFMGKVVPALDRVHDLSTVRALCAVSGELYQLVAAMVGGNARPWGLDVPLARLEKLGERFDVLTFQEIAEEANLDRSLIEPAVMAYEELIGFAHACRVRSVLLPNSSMLDSLLLDTSRRLAEDGATVSLKDTVESAARAVAHKFRSSEGHAERVRSLALQLFDELRPITGLDDRHCLLLSVASILHDIGMFVSSREHERHSAYLIEQTEVMGIGADERTRIAQIVRHHRRPFRDIDTRDLGPVATEHRVEVLKLTAILRIADALDNNHHGRVLGLRIEPSADELLVIAETRAGDREGFSDLARSFYRKADLAEELFGMKPKLIEVLAE
jgi:exopolyphosphatase/guanosine-5'-triphosphate,3'-diphosphate pyrophosphatase